MIAFATFDSNVLNILQETVDRAWGGLPPDQRSCQVKERVARAVLRSAARGERNGDRLDSIAVAAIFADDVDAYDIEVREGDMTLASLRSVELPHLSDVWSHIAELAKKVTSPDCRIRVTDRSGKVVVSVGIATARLLPAA